jgi:hypothetical protein
MSGWSAWSREGWPHVRRWTDGRQTVEVRVIPPTDAEPLITGDAWRWSVLIDGREVQTGEIPQSTPAPKLFAPFWAMQAGRAAVAELQLQRIGA